LGLKRGAEALGFNARSVKATPEILDKLDQAPLPAVIHWKGYHWVVLYGQRGKKYIIADPGVGIRYLSKSELAQGWFNGVMLLLQPDASRFFSQPDDSDKPSGFIRFFKRVLPYQGILGEALLINLVPPPPKPGRNFKVDLVALLILHSARFKLQFITTYSLD